MLCREKLVANEKRDASERIMRTTLRNVVNSAHFKVIV